MEESDKGDVMEEEDEVEEVSNEALPNGMTTGLGSKLVEWQSKEKIGLGSEWGMSGVERESSSDVEGERSWYCG